MASLACKDTFLLFVFIYITDVRTNQLPFIQGPTTGNCNNNVTLVCNTENTQYSEWYWLGPKNGKELVTLVNKGEAVDLNKHEESIIQETNNFALTIKNFSLTDAGVYKCAIGFDQSPNRSLSFECKARNADVSVNQQKKLSIVIKKIFPTLNRSSIVVSASVNGSGYTIIPGSVVSQTPNTEDTPFYNVTWVSSSSLSDGSYDYNITVTTITISDPITGSFKIVAPSRPVIRNSETVNERAVVWAKEEEESVLHCVSRGGYPQTNLALFHSRKLVGSLLHIQLENSGTYTVTKEYRFWPSRTDDMTDVLCQSYYNVTGDIPLNGSAQLYLKLKPSIPVVKPVGTVTAGKTASIRCETSGARPAANISWDYRGQIILPNSESHKNATTATFASISTFNRTVWRDDNHQTAKCIVSHEALISDYTATATMTVNFPPQSISMTGNKIIVANGKNNLTLNCKTDEAHPAANIKWFNGSSEITAGVTQTEIPGLYNSNRTSGSLQFNPTRNMDGNKLLCNAANSVNQNSPIWNGTTLELRYSPLVTITGPSPKTVTESASAVVLHCYASGKPTPKFTWYHDNNMLSNSGGQGTGSESNYTIRSVNRTHFGTYKCEASNSIIPNGTSSLILRVRFKPVEVELTLRGTQTIKWQSNDTLQLVCVTGTAFPAATITWKNNSITIPNTSTVAEEDGQYGGKITSQTLSFVPKRYMDGNKIICEGTNILSGSNVVNVTKQLNLRYYPITKVSEGPIKTVIEGQLNQTLTCTASSKPAAKFTWYRGSDMVQVKNGTGTAISNQLIYSIDVVNRNHAGDYRCSADNGITKPDDSDGKVQLIVHYPPSISVTTTNTTINSSNVFITCNATGLPTNCTFSKWKHSWAGTNIRDGLNYTSYGTPTQQIVNITSLSYQDTGMYTCGASNGIKVWGTNDTEMVNSVYLLVKSYPIVTSEEHDKGTVKITPRLNKEFVFNVSFYSNAHGTSAFLYRESNATFDGNITYEFVNTTSIDIKEAVVELDVYGKPVYTQGYYLTLYHTFYDSSEYGNYSLKIRNEIGTKEVLFSAIPESAPCTPLSLAIEAFVETAISVSWVRCYHGGFAQTFVIQYREADQSWTNGTLKEDGKSTDLKKINSTISRLKPATTYYIRMFAFNVIGRSNFTETITATTKYQIEDPTSSSSVGLIAGAAVGGFVMAALIVALLLVFHRRRKNYKKSPSKNLLKENERPGSTRGTDDTPEINLNPMYESAGPLPSTSSNSGVYFEEDKNKLKAKPVVEIYSQVNKPIKKQISGGSEVKNDVYAQVQKRTLKGKDAGTAKNKKQKSDKKTRKEKKTEGDLYDNVETAISTETKGDNVYENPSCRMDDEQPRQIRNKDGLIYADLDLPNKPVGKDRQAIIHGLDDRTDYADIKFGEVGEQAPESDEENTNKDN